MKTNGQRISVKILGKEYQISCPAGQEADLARAAYNLDQKMLEIKNSGKVYGLERIAVMSALNLTHDLLMYEKQHEEAQLDINKNIDRIDKKVEAILTKTSDYKPTFESCD